MVPIGVAWKPKSTPRRAWGIPYGSVSNSIGPSPRKRSAVTGPASSRAGGLHDLGRVSAWKSYQISRLGICRTLNFATSWRFRVNDEGCISRPRRYRQIPSKKMKLRFETNGPIFSWLSQKSGVRSLRLFRHTPHIGASQSSGAIRNAVLLKSQFHFLISLEIV